MFSKNVLGHFIPLLLFILEKKWIHFSQVVGAFSKTKNVMDGHASHKELSVFKYARNHYIHMLNCPPHTTHQLQPLDRSFMKPFKTAFSETSAKWVQMNPGA